MIKRTAAKIKNNRFFDGVNLSIFAVIFVVIGGYIILKSFAATPPAIYLTPATSTINTSTDFTVQIMEDSGTATVNAVQANLTYPSNLLDAVSIDTTGSSFTTVAESSASNGNIKFGAGTATGSAGVSGQHLVATIHFKSKTTAGAASVTFVNGTALVDAGSNNEILGGVDNNPDGTYTINASTPPAANGHIYLTPASATVATNTGFSVQVRENSGTTSVNAVQANLTYPASSLDVTGISTSSGAFSLVAESTALNGNIKIGLGVGAGTPAKTGDQLVATIQFKSKTATGVANVGFATGTAIINSATNNDILGALTNSTGGSYTINAASSPPATGGGSGQTNNSSSTKTGSSTTNKGTGSASSNISTNNTSSTGTTDSSQLSESSSETFNTEDNTAVEPSYTVTIKVVDSKGNGVSGKSVTLNGSTKKTDKNGLVTFNDVLAGRQQVKISGTSKPFTIDVTASEAGVDGAAVQEFTLKLSAGSSVWKYVAGALIGLAVISAIVILTSRRPRGPTGTITPQAVDPTMEQQAVIMPNKDS